MRTILDTIILLGALQGFIFSLLLFFGVKRSLQKKLLAWLIFLISLASIKLYGAGNGWFDNPVMRWIDTVIPFIIVMPIGPLIYFFVRASLLPEFSVGRREKRHFYAVVLDAVPQLTAIIFFLGVILEIFERDASPWGVFIDQYNVYSDIPRWISISLYLYLSSKLLSTQPEASFKWLREIVTVFMLFQIIWLIYLIPYVIPKYTGFMLDTFDWYPVYVPLAILVYWLAIRGYIAAQTETNKIKKALADPKIVADTMSRLRHAMQNDKLFLDPELTVTKLADLSGIPAKSISAVLNQHLNKSFNEFVNEYRVELIRQWLLAGDARNVTIASLAYDAGFNSLPTFQRAFKSITGLTPSQFLAKSSGTNSQIRI